jgi:uncharacterized membrane protein YjfL (UPF0719 family)
MQGADLAPKIILSSVVYASIGMLLMIAFIAIFDKVFKLQIQKELFKDQNVAFGIVLAGVAIAIAIIIAAAIN